MASESIQRETLVIIIVINWLIAFLLHLPLDLPPQTTMPSPTSLSMDCQCSTRLIVLRLPLVLFWPTYLSYYHCWPKPLNCRYSSPSGVRWLRHCLCVYHCWYHPSLLWLVCCTHGHTSRGLSCGRTIIISPSRALVPCSAAAPHQASVSPWDILIRERFFCADPWGQWW